MAVKGNAKFEEELSCTFKNDMRNLANFYRMENIDFILESKMKLNQNENSKRLDRQDAVRELCFTLKINE